MFQQSSDCSLNVYSEKKVAGQVVAPIIFVSWNVYFLHKVAVIWMKSDLYSRQLLNI